MPIQNTVINMCVNLYTVYIFNFLLANTVGILIANIAAPYIVKTEKDIPVMVS